MSMLTVILAFERATPFLLFALYLITSFQICRYTNWRDAGAPNPFLPHGLKPLAHDFEKKVRIETHV